MAQIRFEDTLEAWREKSRAGLEELRDDLVAQLMNAWPTQQGDMAPPMSELQSAARVALNDAVPAVAERFAEAAVEHVERQRKLPRLPSHDVVAREVTGSFKFTAARPELAFPPPTLRTRPVMWVLPAIVGAFIGVLVFPPLSWLLWGDRQIGLVLGGPLGAGIVTLLAAALSDHPKVRLAVQAGLGMLAVAEVAGWLTSWGRIWAYLGLGSQTLWHRVRRILLWLAAIVALQLTRARPVLKRDDVKDVASRQIELALRGYLDLLLSIAWAHPDVAAAFRPEGSAGGGAMPETSVLEALTKMRRFVEHEEAATELLIAAREALEALELTGVEMREYPDGQPFEPEMKEFFDLLYPLEAGTPVRTLKPALIKNGQAVVRGHLDRSRKRK